MGYMEILLYVPKAIFDLLKGDYKPKHNPEPSAAILKAISLVVFMCYLVAN